MSIIKSLVKLCLASAVGVAALTGPALAEFPEKSIKIIVPFKPGGGSDRIARTLDIFTENEFGRSMIFDYKTGTGGHVGMGVLANSKPDGYTIGTYNTPDVAIGPMTGAAQYTLDDFTFLGRVALDPVVVTTPVGSAYQSMADFTNDAKNQPGKVRVGIAGPKGGTHLAALDFFGREGLEVAVVLFGGGSELAAAVLGQQVDVGMWGLAPFLGSMEMVRLIGIAGDKRHGKAPDVPTLQEQGLDLVIGTGRIFLAPAGLEPEVAARLTAGIKAIFDLPEYEEEMEKISQQTNWQDGDTLVGDLKAFSESAVTVIETYN